MTPARFGVPAGAHLQLLEGLVAVFCCCLPLLYRMNNSTLPSVRADSFVSMASFLLRPSLGLYRNWGRREGGGAGGDRQLGHDALTLPHTYLPTYQYSRRPAQPRYEQCGISNPEMGWLLIRTILLLLLLLSSLRHGDYTITTTTD